MGYEGISRRAFLAHGGAVVGVSALGAGNAHAVTADGLNDLAAYTAYCVGSADWHDLSPAGVRAELLRASASARISFANRMLRISGRRALSRNFVAVTTSSAHAGQEK